MKTKIYKSLEERKKSGHKSFAVLIDPDKVDHSLLDELMDLSISAKVDYLLVGGSLVISNHIDDVVSHINKICSITFILFLCYMNIYRYFTVSFFMISCFSFTTP